MVRFGGGVPGSQNPSSGPAAASRILQVGADTVSRAVSHEIIGRTRCASGKWSFYAVFKFGIKNLFITLGLKIINFQDSEAYSCGTRGDALPTPMA